jgi:hypothetical protein
LIALIIDAHRSARQTCIGRWFPSTATSQRARFIKDQFASNTPEDVAVMLRPLTEALAFDDRNHQGNRMYFLFTM